MQVKAAIVIAACVAGVSNSVEAAPSDLSTLSPAECTVPAVVGTLRYESLQRSAKLGKATLPVLEGIEKLSSSVKDNSRPVGEQLSPSDLGQFGSLRQRLLTLQVKQLIESRYDKHLELLQQMVQAEDMRHRWGKEPEVNGPYGPALAVLPLLAQSDPINGTEPPRAQTCTLEWSLDMLAQDSYKLISSPSINDAATQLSRMKSSYGFPGAIDPSKLSAKDSATFQRLLPVINQAREARDHIESVEQLKLLASAAELLRTASMQDIDESAGDIDSIGTTLRRMKDDKKIDDRMLIRIGIWNALDNKFPSEYIETMKKMQSVGQK